MAPFRVGSARDGRRTPHDLLRSHNGAAGVDALPDGRIFVASPAPCLGLIDARGEAVWTISSPILDSEVRLTISRVSQDGNCVDFGYVGSAEPVLRFDVRSLTLSSPRPNDGMTFAPLREGLTIDGWRERKLPDAERPRASARRRARAKPRDRSGREALLPRLELWRSGRSTTREPRNGAILVEARFGR